MRSKREKTGLLADTATAGFFGPIIGGMVSIFPLLYLHSDRVKTITTPLGRTEDGTIVIRRETIHTADPILDEWNWISNTVLAVCVLAAIVWIFSVQRRSR